MLLMCERREREGVNIKPKSRIVLQSITERLNVKTCVMILVL